MIEDVCVVFGAEFARRIRSRAFIFGTSIVIVTILFMLFIPSIVVKAVGGTTKALVLVGPSELRAPAKTLLERDPDVRVAGEVDAAPNPMTLEFLDAHGRAAAAIVLARSREGLHATVFARDPGGFPTGPIGRLLIPLNLALGTGLSTEKVAPYARNPLEVRGVQTRYATEESADFARATAYGLVFIMYFAIVFNAQAIMSSVAEEKTSRVAELLVATMHPSALLAGKVLSVGAAGLIQIALWLATGLLVAPATLAETFGLSGSAAPAAIGISPGEMGAFIGFFAIGYFQFSMLFAAAASLVSRTEDLGSLMGPLMLPIVVAFLMAQYTLVAPNGQASVITSLIPLISPFVMFTREVVAEVPAWQTALSVALNLLVLLAIVPISGKVYRVGMLLYGRTPKLSQIWAVLRST